MPQVIALQGVMLFGGRAERLQNENRSTTRRSQFFDCGLTGIPGRGGGPHRGPSFSCPTEPRRVRRTAHSLRSRESTRDYPGDAVRLAGSQPARALRDSRSPSHDRVLSNRREIPGTDSNRRAGDRSAEGVAPRRADCRAGTTADLASELLSGNHGSSRTARSQLVRVVTRGRITVRQGASDRWLSGG